MSDHVASLLTNVDWEKLRRSLDDFGYAKLPRVLSPAACKNIMDTYGTETYFRSTINMARYRFGIGEYKYYNAPLPELLQQLRETLYPGLAITANRWLEQLGQSPAYPHSLTDFLTQCHQAGQTRLTPLLLKYETGGYNCLHQDLYGDVFFPFQVVFALNQRGADFIGGAAPEGAKQKACHHFGTRRRTHFSNQPSSGSGNARLLQNDSSTWRSHGYVRHKIQFGRYFP